MKPTTEEIRNAYAAFLWIDEAISETDGGAQFDRWLADRDARIRDDERKELFSELTKDIYFDSDEDRRLKAVFRRREEKAPVLWVRATSQKGDGQ